MPSSAPIDKYQSKLYNLGPETYLNTDKANPGIATRCDAVSTKAWDYSE